MHLICAHAVNPSIIIVTLLQVVGHCPLVHHLSVTQGSIVRMRNFLFLFCRHDAQLIQLKEELRAERQHMESRLNQVALSVDGKLANFEAQEEALSSVQDNIAADVAELRAHHAGVKQHVHTVRRVPSSRFHSRAVPEAGLKDDVLLPTSTIRAGFSARVDSLLSTYGVSNYVFCMFSFCIHVGSTPHRLAQLIECRIRAVGMLVGTRVWEAGNCLWMIMHIGPCRFQVPCHSLNQPPAQ